MEKKRSIGISIISRFEMVVGALGSIFFLLSGIFVSVDPSCIADGIPIIIGWLPPFLLILVTGELTFRLKPLGRVLHLLIIFGGIILSTICYFGTMELFGILFLVNPFDLFHNNTILWASGNLILLFLLYFFSKKSVIEQFKET